MSGNPPISSPTPKNAAPPASSACSPASSSAGSSRKRASSPGNSSFDPEGETSSSYYQAVLQNLFFATLNQRMGKDGNGKPYRVFAKDEGFQKNRAIHNVNYRCDFLSYGSILVELKALQALSDSEEAQAIDYIKASGLEKSLQPRCTFSSIQTSGSFSPETCAICG